VLPVTTGAAGDSIWATLVRNGTYYVPTLVAYERGFVLWGSDTTKVAIRSRTHAQHMGLIKSMHRAGVQIMAGSDFSDWALVAGVDLHNELALLVESGFTPMEAIQAATVKPANFLGMADSLGTIEVGKVADLVLLDADPLEDISHTRKIRAVVVGGRLVPVAELRYRFTEVNDN
jgi:imidazolonepropionase-like amidohydrolase